MGISKKTQQSRRLPPAGKTQTTAPTAPEGPGWGLDVTLSDSSTPPDQITPQKTSVAPEPAKKRPRRKLKEDNEESDSNQVGLPPQAEPDGSGTANAFLHQLVKESTTNPLLPHPSKKPARKLKLLFPSREVSSTSKQSRPSNKQASLPEPSPSTPPPPKRRKCLDSSPPQGPATPNKTSVPLNTQPSPVDPPNPSQPENPIKPTSQPVEKGPPPKQAVQEGPPDSVGVNSDPSPGAAAATKEPQVPEPEHSQNEAIVESGNQSEDSLVKSLPGDSILDSLNKSDIESLYGSPSPGKTITEPGPIELDSDPDFEMMEQMLLSHRGPSSQSQSIGGGPTAKSPASFNTKSPPKRQWIHPSLNNSSRVPTQTPQTDLKPAKWSRLDGSRSSDSTAVSNDRRKHPEFWDLDGTVILQVDDVLFRVMRSTLSKASPWFQRLFNEERDHLEIMAGCPVYMIEDFDHLDFADLLRGLENGLEYALNPPHYLRIASIFRAASLLEFSTLRKWSLGCLKKQWPTYLPQPSKPSKFGSKIPWAEETLTIANRLEVPQLIKRAYWELCSRPEFGRIDAEVYDNEVEEIMPTRSRLSRSVLMDLTRIRERLLPEWTRITRYPPIGVPCARATRTPSTSTPTTQPTPCSLNYMNWHKVILEVEVNGMTIDDRRTDPISALEVMIVEIDWEKEGGFCPDCVQTWKIIWTKDREKIWKNLGDWLGLDAAAES